VRDGHVLERNVELGRALDQVRLYAVRYGLSLCDELCGVELGYDGLEDFVADRGQDSLVVVCAEVLHQVVSVWSDNIV
jgi:hypothetical protein